MAFQSTRAGAFQVLSLSRQDVKTRDYRRRKIHQKTNLGCIACKLKKVKCDELRPICSKCRRNERSCTYSNPKDTGLKAPFVGLPSLLSADAMASSLFPIIENCTSGLQLAHHIERHWVDIFSIPRNSDMLMLFKSHSFIRSTMFAIAASHLRHMSPGVLKHRVAEHFQQYLALQEYQKILYTSVTDLGQSEVNALLLNGTLMNLLAFTLPEFEVSRQGEQDVSRSWLFNPDQDNLDWLALQGGLMPLLKAKSVNVADTVKFLSQIFLNSESVGLKYQTKDPKLQDLPKEWTEVFRLDDTPYFYNDESPATSDAANPISSNPPDTTNLECRAVFRPLVVALRQLLRLEPDNHNPFRYFIYLAKVTPRFRDLLKQRDARALWLLGYWLGLMSRFRGLWWCNQRVNRDYKAIRIWLEDARVTGQAGVRGESWTQLLEEFDRAAE